MNNVIEPIYINSIVSSMYNYNDNIDFTAEEVSNNFGFNHNKNIIEYLQDEKNQKMYVKHLENYTISGMNDSVIAYENIKPLLDKKITDLTLEEKLAVDKFYAVFEVGAMDVFHFNQFTINPETLNLHKKVSREKRLELYNFKDKMYGYEKIPPEAQDLLLYILVLNHYVDKNSYELMDLVKKENLLKSDNLSFEELALVLFDNYYAYKYKSIDVNKFNPNTFIIDTSEKFFEGFTYEKLKNEYERVKNMDFDYGSYEAAVVGNYAAYTLFHSELDEVQDIYEELNNKPNNELTKEEFYTLILSEHYVNEAASENFESHILLFKERFPN